MTPLVFCKDLNDQWIELTDPVQVIEIFNLNEILPALNTIEDLVEDKGYTAFGFISYDASPAFDSALHSHIANDFPLLWFGLFKKRSHIQPEKVSLSISDISSQISKDQYEKNIRKIKSYIAAGDTYQVNFTFPMKTRFKDDPQKLFLKLTGSQPTPYSAYIETDDFAVCSSSPELFLQLEGNAITTRPMKGTRPRACTLSDDTNISRELQESEKDRAENLMIVDMIRNDLGRIAEKGTVHVDQLFHAEKYPTVWQMTSQISAKTKAGLADIMKAMFPCSSITGAPKPHTTEIIKELEVSPRKVYTGCIGLMTPGRKMKFSVAIRTGLINKLNSELEYHVGSGIVWDSDPAAEYQECLDKARIFHFNPPEFEILESLLYDSDGYFLLDYHFKRMEESANYFDYPWKRKKGDNLFEEFLSKNLDGEYKIRLLLDQYGQFRLESYPIQSESSPQRNTVSLAKNPVNSNNRFLYHKTTFRTFYQDALKDVPADDVILWNEREEITEASSSNVVIEKDGSKYTPPISCGLLGGTFRSYLLDQGEIEEKIIFIDDLRTADAIYLINSVRKWQKVSFI